VRRQPLGTPAPACPRPAPRRAMGRARRSRWPGPLARRGSPSVAPQQQLEVVLRVDVRRIAPGPAGLERRTCAVVGCHGRRRPVPAFTTRRAEQIAGLRRGRRPFPRAARSERDDLGAGANARLGDGRLSKARAASLPRSGNARTRATQRPRSCRRGASSVRAGSPGSSVRGTPHCALVCPAASRASPRPSGRAPRERIVRRKRKHPPPAARAPQRRSSAATSRRPPAQTLGHREICGRGERQRNSEKDQRNGKGRCACLAPFLARQGGGHDPAAFAAGGAA